MTLLADIITIGDDGEPTAALDPNSLTTSIYSAFVDNYLTDTGFPFPSEVPAKKAIKKGFATMANRLAFAIVDHITNHADVTVGVADAGLQRDADGANPPTLAPAAPVVIAGAVS
jgi:hypothetical protein